MRRTLRKDGVERLIDWMMLIDRGREIEERERVRKERKRVRERKCERILLCWKKYKLLSDIYSKIQNSFPNNKRNRGFMVILNNYTL